MKFWMKNYPDVITGWNTKFFDLPYLMNRIKSQDGLGLTKRFANPRIRNRAQSK